MIARFAPPTYADELAKCNDCGVTKHHSDLDENGLCVECRKETEEEYDQD
jgi:predicted Zn-ribbon and HTH transcriptional regulator